MSSRQRSFRLVRLRGVVAHETGTDGSYMGYGIGAGDSYGDYGGSTSSFHTVLAKPPGPPQGSPPCLLQISHSCGTQRYPKADRKPLLSRRSATPCPSRARTNDQRPRTMLRDGSREGRSPFAGVPGAEPPTGFPKGSALWRGVGGRTPNRDPGAAPLVSDAVCFPVCGGASAERRS